MVRCCEERTTVVARKENLDPVCKRGSKLPEPKNPKGKFWTCVQVQCAGKYIPLFLYSIMDFRGPILEFARDSFPSTFPRLLNESSPTAFLKSHQHLTASHRSRFVERKVRVVCTVRHSNLAYEITGIKLLWRMTWRQKYREVATTK